LLHNGWARGVALAHDYLLVLRGAERTFAAMAEAFPEAPVHTLLYDRAATGQHFDGRDVRTSFLQRTSVRQDGFRRLLPLFPLAADRMDLSDARLVVSSSSAFAHGFRAAADAVHVCYCHSPFRYVWHERGRALTEFPPALRSGGRRLLDRVRAWDLKASERVTHYVANSKVTQERIAEFYGRESTVIHPPVAVERFRRGTPEDFFLVVCELVRHKNVDVALDAARRVGARVVVVGTGPDRERLVREHGDHAEFRGRIDDDQLADLYSRCRALLMPAVEEFGITAVEAMAAGRPVIACAKGGALETVTPKTGVLVPVRDVDALAEAMQYSDFTSFDPEHLRRRAERFSTAVFQQNLTLEVERVARGGREAPFEAEMARGGPRFGRAARAGTPPVEAAEA
jgi:glycosyltransferase involved in cell wall biosynthesis